METIAEKSRAKEIIDRLQGIIKNASQVPLAAGKVSVYKDEVQSLLDELAMQMDAELKTYHEVNDRRGKIINEAKKEAEQIIYQAEHTASRIRVTKRSTNVAALDHTSFSEEEISSLTEANEIYAASLIYTDEMLTEVTKLIEDAYHNIRSDYEVVMQVFEDKMQTLIQNKNELMTGLQELDEKDRSQQILEIGQLLSDELYNERMKQKMNSDQYDDGSVQLTLDLQIEQAEETARQAEENARQAEETARQTAKALEQMTAQRDALMETVKKMQREEAAESAKTPGETTKPVMPEKKPVQATMTEEAEDEEEYEVIYVTEDELEEGEEYEIEYVDEEEAEFEDEAKSEDETEAEIEAEVEKEAEEEAEAEVKIEAESETETEVKTEKKKGFIEKALLRREQEEADLVVEGNEDMYVQATMKFEDEDVIVIE